MTESVEPVSGWNSKIRNATLKISYIPFKSETEPNLDPSRVPQNFKVLICFIYLLRTKPNWNFGTDVESIRKRISRYLRHDFHTQTLFIILYCTTVSDPNFLQIETTFVVHLVTERNV